MPVKTSRIGRPGPGGVFKPEMMLQYGYRIFDIRKTIHGTNFPGSGKGLYVASFDGGSNAVLYIKGSSGDYPMPYGAMIWEHIYSEMTCGFIAEAAGGEYRARARQEASGGDLEVTKSVLTETSSITTDGTDCDNDVSVRSASLAYRLFFLRNTGFTHFTINQYGEGVKSVANDGTCYYNGKFRCRFYVDPLYLNDVRPDIQDDLTVTEIT